MHVAVLGAGALGAVYGVRLAVRGRASGTSVTFVVRPARAASREPIVIERVRGGEREELASPVRAAVLPGDTDVALIAVGTEDLEAVRAVLGASEAPIVVLTPMMPKDFARMREAFGARVLAAMPSVVAYTRQDDGVVRYWLPPARTRIDEPRTGELRELAHALADALTDAGLTSHLELAVHETNPATTVCAIPLAMALCVAGSLSALADDAALCDLAARACAEGVAIGRRIGRPEVGAMLAPALGRPWALRATLRLLERLSPEAVYYAEEHFARKLRAQNLMMAREMVELARDRGLTHEALDTLAKELEGQVPDVVLDPR